MAESQSSNIQPRALKRELSSVLHLFKADNFDGVTNDQGVGLNMSKILSWMVPTMAEYCDIFDMEDCSRNNRTTTVKSCQGLIGCERAREVCRSKQRTKFEIENQVQEYAECQCAGGNANTVTLFCLLYTSPSPRDRQKSRMPSSA